MPQLVPQQQTVQYYQSVGFPQQSTTDYFESAVQGVVATSPIVQAARMLKTKPVNGLGQSDGFQDLVWVIAAVGVVMGVMAYQAGSAMAPNRSDKRMWGIIGIPMGFIGGPIGLGVMGIISNSQKKG